MNYKKGTQTRRCLKSVMRYVSQVNKTLWDGQQLVSGIGCQPETAFDEFLSTKLLHHKDGGVMFYHMVQSFPKGAAIDSRTAHEAARQLAGYFEGCEVLVCTHVDRKHIHSHCIINSVNFETGITAEATFTMKNICLAYGVSFMDLEVDVPVGKVKIRKVYCLQDSGKIINPQLAEGQMHGGVAMGIGYALGEQMLFDAATGRPLNNNLLDYKIPTCMDIPDMEIRFVETHEDSAPFGAKGLAEPPLIPQAAAVRNAILHATGVGMHKLPMNPQNLVHAFGEAGLIAQ